MRDDTNVLDIDLAKQRGYCLEPDLHSDVK